MRKYILLLCSLWYWMPNHYAQIIPEHRMIDWASVGYKGEYWQPQHILDVTNFGAIANDTLDDAPAIQMAIDSALPFTQIYIPSGHYRLLSTINLKDSIQIIGDGASATHLDIGHQQLGFFIKGTSNSTDFVNITAGFNKGSNAIEVTDASGFEIGDYAELRQLNDSLWDTNPISWSQYSVGQIVEINDIQGNTLYIVDELRNNFDTSLQLEIHPITPMREVGLGCFSMERSLPQTSPSGNSGQNIRMDKVVQAWVIGIESDKSYGPHCGLQYCSQIDVKGCYFYNAYIFDGTGGNGYGVMMRQHTGQCLVEDNIFDFLRHPMMVKEGANGNVFAYNYSKQTNRSEPVASFSGDISLHGQYPFANLFEGNIVQDIMIDQYWGGNGMYNTFLRNRAERHGFVVLDDATVTTDSSNVLGNEITKTNIDPTEDAILPSIQAIYYHLSFSQGNIEYANNVDGTITPANTTPFLDSSYYLSGYPSFWTAQTPYPSIGYPNTINTGTIPAYERFWDNSALVKTYCVQPIVSPPTGIENLSNSTYNILAIYPNPTNSFINIIPVSDTNNGSIYTIKIFDIIGQLIHYQQSSLPTQVDISGLSSSQYIITIENENGQLIDQQIILKTD